MKRIWRAFERRISWLYVLLFWTVLVMVIAEMLSPESEPSDAVVLLSAVISTSIFSIWGIARSKRRQMLVRKIRAKRKLIVDELAAAVHTHRDALVMNWQSTVRVDEYGKTHLKQWQVEVQRFLESIDFKYRDLTPEEAERHVTLVIRSFVNALPSAVRSNQTGENQNLFAGVTDALEFEAACAEVLKSIGWSARLTTGSGDQGVDVIAQKGDSRIVVQCKMYGKPVGNKAVQEAFAGMAYSNANIAAVVAPNGFTRSARELADRTGVYLISPKDLHNLNTTIRAES